MEKIKIDSNAFVYPMPMVLVGAVVDGKPNLAITYALRRSSSFRMYFNYGLPAALFRSRYHPDIACSTIENTSVVCCHCT